MGLDNAPEKCFITDEVTQNIRDSFDDIYYQVIFAGQTFRFAFDNYHKNSDFVEKNKFILKGLIINKKFPYSRDRKIYSNERLETIIKEAIIPRSPNEKLENLLLFLHSYSGYDGQVIEPDRFISKDLMLLKLYFKNQKEYFFYLSTLKEKGLLTFLETTNKGGDDAIHIKLTYEGLLAVISLQEDGKLSKNCFIAMSFSDSLISVRETIKEAIRECNYMPVLVDEIPIDSEVTINDAIISNLRKSKFIVADFSEQKRGVYFEAGYALGQGKQVIYICSEKDFQESHFDTNHYPHIKYNELGDLKVKLINRIQAWIV